MMLSPKILATIPWGKASKEIAKLKNFSKLHNG
jgi:hypothetical protein